MSADVCEAALKHGCGDRSKSDIYVYIFLYIQIKVKDQITQSNSPQTGTIWSSSVDLPNNESTLC